MGAASPLPPLLAVVATTVLGALDEGIQWFLPTRVFDPQGHPVQLPCGRYGGRLEHRAGMGAAQDHVPPGARQRPSISTPPTVWTCLPSFRRERSPPTVAAARPNPGIKRRSQSETVSSIASNTRYGSDQSWLYRNLASTNVRR